MPSPWRLAALAAIVSAASVVQAGDFPQHCFRLLDEPLPIPPFSDREMALMRKHFLENIDVRGTGAVMASPGETPALAAVNAEGGYRYDWPRDAAISIISLMQLADSPVATAGEEAHVTEAVVESKLRAYASWVRHVKSKDGEAIGGRALDAHGEPKWDLETRLPYDGSWCRPQTDGPALRAKALMLYANRTKTREHLDDLWDLIKFDLDWIARGDSINQDSCDLWEETGDKDFLWNRMAMRSALIMGSHFSRGLRDYDRADTYLSAAQRFIGNVIKSHQKEHGPDVFFISQCSARSSPKAPCHAKGKEVDGAVILSMVHSGWLDLPEPLGLSLEPASSPASAIVAHTVRLYTERFCGAYPVNQRDSRRGLPGVLYGRYEADVYGGGNPWVLVTAALASLFYQVAQAVSFGAPVGDDQLRAWRAALGAPGFGASPSEFVAAGDSVLVRLHAHVEADDFRLFEQIGKESGRQYNAKDLTWSYAEVLSALRERAKALDWIASTVRRLGDGAHPSEPLITVAPIAV